MHISKNSQLVYSREANFYLTHPFFGLSLWTDSLVPGPYPLTQVGSGHETTGRIANWQTAHAREGGVQPLNFEAN